MIPHIVREGPPLDKADRVIVVIHGMSTTVDTLRTGYPATPESRLTKLYWRLPVLRDGAESIRQRRAQDPFYRLFSAVIDESRAELSSLLAQLNGPVGLFGFSIGSLIALFGALDNPQAAAVATMGGVPSLDYLQHYLPDYDWTNDAVKNRLNSYDLVPVAGRFAHTPVLLCHGELDDVAHWEWMAPFAQRLLAVSPLSRVEKFAHLQHRLAGQTPDEQSELAALRALADDWFLEHVPLYHAPTR
jgi:alpha-beta hydrolase superfamily lysophospholipase